MKDLRIEKGKKTKILIIKTALNILFNEGLIALTTRRLCEESGVSKGNLYHHFKNMEEVIDETFLFTINESYNSVTSTNLDSESLYDFLVEIVNVYLEKVHCENKKTKNSTVVFWEIIMREKKLINKLKEVDIDMANWILNKLEVFIKKELNSDLKEYVINVIMTFLSGTKFYIFFMDNDIERYKKTWKTLAKHLEEKITKGDI
jgi:AcrR family transcriptional regulator